MRLLCWLWFLMAVGSSPVGAMPEPESVAILYNRAIPESRRLAEFYREARGIPALNLIALDMPVSADISRKEYDETILLPLRREFQQRGWWKREADGGGVILPVRNQIRVLVTVRGVPLRIRQSPQAAAPAGKPDASKDPFAGHDEAAVDSELAMFGVEGLPLEGGLQNKYHLSTKSIQDAGMPFLVLTARIDAASHATCVRMIEDAVETEKTGLWGMAYVDIANKFPQGDQWLEAVVRENRLTGIPTVVDRFNDTLPKNYPMTHAALYHGWYDWSVSGPFLNSRFKFRKGAVAMHLHSFSAEQLSDPNKNWSAGLLERGAAVTVGNVFEPYLHLTHDFGLLHKNLLAGDCWVEACWKSIPVTSWQGVVLGDPLYRPFLHLQGTGERAAGDNDFRALRAAAKQWVRDPVERRVQLGKAVERTGSGVLAEALGLEFLAYDRPAEAVPFFQQAKERHTADEDKLRNEFHLIAMDRAAGRKDIAIRSLRDALPRFSTLPEVDSLKGWLDILDPPPPPPADPAKGLVPTPAAPKP